MRARLNVISEEPLEWMKAVDRWRRINAQAKTYTLEGEIPDKLEEYLFYQTLIGSWPIEDLSEANHQRLINRLEEYMIKAIREAKIHSTWAAAKGAYEEAVRQFIDKALRWGPENRFLNDFKHYIGPIVKAGLMNSLAQILLK